MSFKTVFILAFLLILIGCAFKNPFIPPEFDSSIYEPSEPIATEPMYRATMRPYTVLGKKYYPDTVKEGDIFEGIASWYGDDFHGKLTSNGESYNMHTLTAAHKTLPMNTVVKVTNLSNNRSVTVRINDRGPFVKNRIIDLSNKAAYDIDMVKKGTAKVRVEVLHFDEAANKYLHKKEVQEKKSVWKNFEQKPKKQDEIQVVSGGDYLVQVASFSSKDKALAYLKRCYNANGRYNPLVRDKVYDNQTIYKVMLSGFKSVEEARDFIKTANYQGAFIVRK